MPIYEYECEICHHQFEIQQKFSDPLIEKCIQCGNGVRKLISAPGIMFKGTGWYVTDYSNKLKDPNPSTPNGRSEKDGAKNEEKAGNARENSKAGSSTQPSASTTPSSSSAASDGGSSSSSET